jgi:uncharacterized repeat protein (TIGR03803 family)
MRTARLLAAITSFILVFVLIGSAQTVSFVHLFDVTDGQYPAFEAFAQGRDGNLYGTTYGGGASGDGTVFRQSSTGSGNVVLHSFSGSDGANPLSGLTLGSDGNFYGTTVSGGAFGWGTLYKIGEDGTFTLLYSFTGGADGGFPEAAPTLAADGNFYGTTAGVAPNVYPTVYRYSSSHGLTTIYTFSLVTAQPTGWVTQASNGELYVAAQRGGPQNCGSITAMTTSGTAGANYDFPCNPPGGEEPIDGLTLASDGNLYGTTGAGGEHKKGTIFTFNVESRTITFLYSFGSAPGDGEFPYAGLVQGSDGNLYGSTADGGASRSGTLFQITLAGGYTQLYSFAKAYMYSVTGGLGQQTGGLFFGTTDGGGADGAGAVFTLSMGLGPFVAFVQPTGTVAGSAEILGQGLTGTTSVTFNGVAATTFSVKTDTYMTAVVPAGATTGPVVVTTPSGTLTSNVNFRISQ